MKKMLLLSLFIFSTQTYAMFCPYNFAEIQMGDTIETVTKVCGNPDEQKSYKTTDDKAPQEWSYYVNLNQGGMIPLISPQQQNSSYKITIGFNNGQVMNIAAQGQSLQTVPMCGGNVSLGDSMESIKSACGEPTFVSKGQSPQGSAQSAEKKITEFKYNTTPPITLIFEDGKLRERK